MHTLRNRFIVKAQLLAGLGILTFPALTAVAQIPAYPVDLCPNADNVAPLVITVENDTDVDLNIIAPLAYGSYVRPSDNVARGPDEAPEIEDQQPLSEHLCYQDIKVMEEQTLYAHKKYIFQIRRSGYPAHLFVKFRMTPEEPYGEYELARWEYAEEGGAVDATCNIDAARERFTIGCSGDNNISYPVMNINIGHINRPEVPQPLINGGEPGAGPPSTP